MKIAGRKNAGAWYRTNRFIKKLNSGGGQSGTTLINLIKNLDTYQPFIDAVNDLIDQVGSGQVVADLATQYMTVGIPYDVWMGQLSFDTYSKQTNGAGKTIYVADHAEAVGNFATDLRKAVTQFIFGFRKIEDIRNVAPQKSYNPGGVADATPNT